MDEFMDLTGLNELQINMVNDAARDVARRTMQLREGLRGIGVDWQQARDIASAVLTAIAEEGSNTVLNYVD